jgi:hypothetical protein
MKHYEVVVKFILHQIGEPTESENLSNTLIFKKYGEEVGILYENVRLQAYQFSIDRKLYETILGMFYLDKKELNEILKKILYNLTGIQVSIIEANI